MYIVRTHVGQCYNWILGQYNSRHVIKHVTLQSTINIVVLSYYIARTHLSFFLSHFPFLTVILRSARRSTIKCYFTAASRADKERLFCLFQMKKCKWNVWKRHIFFVMVSETDAWKPLINLHSWILSLITHHYDCKIFWNRIILIVLYVENIKSCWNH